MTDSHKVPSYRWQRIADHWTTHASGPLEWMDSRTGGSSLIVAARCDGGWRAIYKPDARPSVSAWGKSRNAAAQAAERAARQHDLNADTPA